MNAELLLALFDRVSEAPDAVAKLRRLVLDLAVRGKLVEQDAADEPAALLLDRIDAERQELIEKGHIRRDKPPEPVDFSTVPYGVPKGWTWARIGRAVLFTQYGTSQQSHPSERGVPVLAMGNIQDGLVVQGKEKKIPDTSDELPALFLDKFDLLYNRTNSAELVGKTGIYLGESAQQTFASYLIRLRPSLRFSDPTYLNIAMNAPQFRTTQIVPHIKQQTGQANVNGTALKNMLIPLPPLTEQRRIVARVDELMGLCDQLEASLTAADATRARLLDTLIHEALNGADLAEAA